MESKSNYYIVFEYCSGGDLQQFLKKKKKVPIVEAMVILNQIKEAYLYLMT